MNYKVLIAILAVLYSNIFGSPQTEEPSGPMQPEGVVEIDLGENVSAVELHP